MVDSNTLDEKIEEIIEKVEQCIPPISNKTEHALKKNIYDSIETLKKDIIQNKYNQSQKEYGFALQILVNIMSTSSEMANNASLRTGIMAYAKDLQAFIKNNL